MRRVSLLFGLVLALFSFTLPVRAIELITIGGSLHAREFAGVVVDQMGAPVAGVLIEDCIQTFGQRWTDIHEKKTTLDEPMLLDCNTEPKHILASATTDSKGRFKFPKTKMGTMHYLHLSCPGFDPMQITVKLRWFARRNLRIKLFIAT
jgi:hypothetical protein